MELEKQVCSLDLAKRLKELGMKQESFLWWTECMVGSEWVWHIHEKGSGNWHSHREPDISAFTVAELGEMLKSTVKNRDVFRIDLPYWYDAYGKPTWQWEESIKKDAYGDCADTEADARAKMLIYLLEENLLVLA